MGIFHTALASFDAAEQVCQSQYAPCTCAARPTETDTGQIANDESAIEVECRSDECTTYVP